MRCVLVFLLNHFKTEWHVVACGRLSQPTLLLSREWVITSQIKQQMQYLIPAVLMPWVIWGRVAAVYKTESIVLELLVISLHLYIHQGNYPHTATYCSPSASIFCRQKGGMVHFITSHMLKLWTLDITRPGITRHGVNMPSGEYLFAKRLFDWLQTRLC